MKEKDNKKIGIDIDDTLFPFVNGLVTYLNKYTWKNIKFEEIHTFDILSLWEIKIEELKNIIKENNLYQDWIISNNILNTLSFLIDNNYEIIFITSRFTYQNYNTEKYTKEWLKNHNLNYKVYFSKNKWKTCEELKIDYFIDDWLHNILNVLEISKETKTFLIDKPWNRLKEEEKLKLSELHKKKIKRLNCLSEVKDFL